MIENLKRQLLPIAMVTAVVSAILNINNSGFVLILTLLSFAACALLFCFFNKVSSSGKYGAFLYIMALVAVEGSAYFLVNLYDSPGNFIVWLLDSQTEKTFIIPYVISCFVILNFLFASFIYYFTQIIWRSLFVFFVMIIPFSLYARQDVQMPGIYIAAIMGLYIAVMVQCRHTARGSDVKLVMDDSYQKSVLIFVVLSVLFAMLIPKPVISPFREKVAGSFGDVGRILNTAGGFGEITSQSNKGSTKTADKIIYRVKASESLYLRRQTFDLYQGEYWVTEREYGMKDNPNWHKNKDNHFSNLMKTLKKVADQDKKFARKYHITPVGNLVENRRTAVITLGNFKSRCILSVNNIKSVVLNHNNLNIFGSLNNDLVIGENKRLNREETYTINYYSESVDRRNYSIDFAKNLTKNTYENMLADASYFYSKHKDKDAKRNLDVIMNHYNMEENAYDYYESTYQPISENIRQLAISITKDCYSDYDKAAAIEQYFTEMGYHYDLNYKPEKGKEGLEYFILESKKGSCSDYAGAMTLMARAIGLPARYVEGFVMSEKESGNAYVVRDSDAHAFTEIFISGYGWMTFDATVSDPNQKKEKASFLKLNVHQIRTLNIFCLISLLLAAAVTIMMPVLKEAVFRIKLKLIPQDKAVIMMYRHLTKRLGKKLRISTEALTVKLIEEKIQTAYELDIRDLTGAFEKVCYGGKMLTEEEFYRSYDTYLKFYNVSRIS